MSFYRIEIGFEYSGAALYALIFNRAGQCWDGSGFVEFTGDHSLFGLDLTEHPTRTYIYGRTIATNSIPPGTYTEEIWERVGAEKNRLADRFIGDQKHYWIGGRDYPYDMMAMGERGGNIAYPCEVLDKRGQPVYNAHVWLCVDEDGYHPICARRTNHQGKVVLYGPAGDYYLFRQANGVQFDNPIRVTLSED